MTQPWGDRKGRADVTAAPCSPSPVPSGVWGSSESTQLLGSSPGSQIQSGAETAGKNEAAARKASAGAVSARPKMKNLVTSELDGAEVQILGRGVNLAASCMTAVPFASSFCSKSAKEGLWCDV